MLRRMASPPRTRESEEERQRRLNARTLVIASAASASAAAVTSQLWIRGTWIAAAITPVIVAVVSELLHRPSERIARALTTDQPQLILDEAPEPATDGVRPDRDAPRPDPAAPPVARPSSRGGVSGAPGPVRVYRQPAQVSKPPRIAVGVVLTTALIALLVAVVVITVPELIVGQSLGSGDNATTFGGGKARHKSSKSGQTTTSTDTQATTPSNTTSTNTDTTGTDQSTAPTNTPTTTAPTTPAPSLTPRTTP